MISLSSYARTCRNIKNVQAAKIGACVSGSVMLEAMGHKLLSGEPFRATKYSLFVNHMTDLAGLFDAELEEDVFRVSRECP